MNSVSQPLQRLHRTTLAVLGSVAVSLVLVACGGGGTVPSTGVQLRALSSEFTSRKAVAYSPFRSGDRDTETITAAMVKEDLDLLLSGGFTLIRLFDSSDKVAKLTLQVIEDNKLDIKVMLGAYILSESSPSLTATQKANNMAFNAAEVARAVALANAYKNTVLAVSVGNETMVSWSFVPSTPAVMAGYLKTVRSQITQPVTTDDNWAFFADAPASITDVIDFAAVHTYPLLDTVHLPGKYDWQQTSVAAAARAAAMADASIDAAKSDYNAVRSYLDGKGLGAIPIVIGETGWKAVASGGETSRAHPVNQKMYFDRLATWAAAGKTGAGPKNIFYFEAFDEPWKQGDDKWGLFNVNRQARYVVQSLYPASRWEPGAYTAADALYYVPVVANPTITANRYSAYTEAATSGEAKPAEVAVWNAWDGGKTAAAPEVGTSAAPTDPSKGIEITPIPAAAGWGWGLALQLPTTSDNLGNFANAGYLNFSIKTTYPGKLEVGFFTGSVADGSGYDVYLPIAPGEYGYMNDGNWHQVSIPISAITPKGAMAFGMTDASKAKLDLAKVTSPFVIADRYANTGKAANSNHTTKISVDAVYWSK
nr:glycosyl hydrolase family 17 protein [uncultured Albidiferax sp.]